MVLCSAIVVAHLDHLMQCVFNVINIEQTHTAQVVNCMRSHEIFEVEGSLTIAADHS